jgi:hypothetical protein
MGGQLLPLVPSAGTQLYLFGSCANSFGVRNSDVDMCLGVGMAEGTTKSDVVERMAGILNRRENIFRLCSSFRYITQCIARVASTSYHLKLCVS